MSNMWPVKGQKNRWVVGWYEGPRQRKWKRVRGDKATAERIQRHLQNEADLRRNGVVSPAAERAASQAIRPIQQHLGEYIQHIEVRGRAPRYVQQLRARLERFVAFASIQRLNDITAERVDAFVLSLRHSKQSGYTLNEYIVTIKGFTKWALLTSRYLSDPLTVVRRVDGRAITRKRPRRAMSADEVGRFLDAAGRRPLYELQLVRRGPNKGKLAAKVRPRAIEAAKLLGLERQLAYLLALWTGLRRSELAALEWRDIELDTLPPRIVLRAHTTKSKRADKLALHPQIAEALRATKSSDTQPCARVLSAVPSARAFKADLKFAGIEEVTEAGRLDLHALRKSLATFLAASGVPQRIAQAHLRHTDPRLTAVVYTDESLLPVASTIGALPPLPTGPAAAPPPASAASGA
jgi:integrase